MSTKANVKTTSNDSDNEIDDLKRQIRQLEKIAADEKGRVLAAARDAQTARNEARKVREEAEAYRGETDLAIANASQQLQQAWTIGHAIWSLSRFGAALLQRKAEAARVLHREIWWRTSLEKFCAAVEKNDQAALKEAYKEAIQRVNMHKANAEKLNLEINELAIWNGGEKVYKAIYEAVEGED